MNTYYKKLSIAILTTLCCMLLSISSVSAQVTFTLSSVPQFDGTIFIPGPCLPNMIPLAGDNAGNSRLIGRLVFDISGLSGSDIFSAKLKIHVMSIIGNPFNLGPLLIDAKGKPDFNICQLNWVPPNPPPTQYFLGPGIINAQGDIIIDATSPFYINLINALNQAYSLGMPALIVTLRFLNSNDDQSDIDQVAFSSDQSELVVTIF